MTVDKTVIEIFFLFWNNIYTSKPIIGTFVRYFKGGKFF